MIIFTHEGSWVKYLLSVYSMQQNKIKLRLESYHMLRLTWLLSFTFQLGLRSPDLSDSQSLLCPEVFVLK